MSEIMDDVVRKIKILQTRLEFAQFGDRKELKPFDFCICMTAVHSILSQTKPVGLSPTDNPDMEKLKAHLAHKTNAKDQEGIIQYLSRIRSYGCGRKYFDFWSFWHNKPTFKIEDLKEENRRRFEELMEFSKSFEELLGHKGYVAWDVAESIQIVREAYLCKYIDERLAYEIISDFAGMAVRTFQDWSDFAISYICGGCYFMYENNGNLEEVGKMCDTICDAVEQLFFSDNNAVWARYKWQQPKPYFNNFRPTEDLVDSKIGCYVSNRVSLDGCQIKYMERQLPNPQYPDSGWKFMAGDETVEYLSDGNNVAIFSLNLIANYDKEILPLIDSPIGTVYERNEEGKFVLRGKKEK